MSRSGYVDGGDCSDQADWLRMCGYQANIRRCIGGKKGQAFLWELYLALESLPRRELIQGGLVDQQGAYCSLGAVARYRAISIPEHLCITDEGEPDECEFASAMGPLLGIKDMLAREVMYHNDEGDDWHDVAGPPRSHRHSGPRRSDSPKERWYRMRAWVVEQLRNIP